MSGHRKLGRRTANRKSMLRNQVTTLLLEGKLCTTVTRAKETQKIAEKLITLAVREKDNYSTREILVSKAKLDSKGKKLLKSKTSANGKRYDVVERELKTKMVQVDNPSRQAARRKMMNWLVRADKAEAGKFRSPSNYVFDELAPRFAGRSGGYTRIIRTGPRRGDGAEMAVLELV